jgi:LacI family transcriptional regulator, galactose operon repressor
MSKKINIQAIADEVGLSVSTVSRVMNGVAKKYRISDKTIELVKSAAKKFNYTPNNIAKSLRLKKTFTIGLIVPDISNPWFAQIAGAIEKETRKNNYHVFLHNSDDDIKIEKNSLELLKNWNVDGIIIAPIGLEYAHLYETYKNGMPMVLVDRFFENVEIPFIATNDYKGAYEANEYLIKQGHRKIFCIQGLVGSSTNNQRVQGYRKALNDNNIIVEKEFIVGKDFGFQNGYKNAKELIKNLKKTNITAIFSTSNQITLGILRAFKEYNIRIPEDISLISFDEQDYSSLLYTPISTVSHIDENIGKKAIKLLLDQMNGGLKKEHADILLPTHFIKRDSVKSI